MKKDKDPFTWIAIRFLLGVLIGFAMILMGFMFLFIGLLSQADEAYRSSAWKWYLAAIFFVAGGSLLFHYTLKGAPEPGNIAPSGKIKTEWIK